MSPLAPLSTAPTVRRPVALLHSFVGLAATLVGLANYLRYARSHCLGSHAFTKRIAN